MPTTTHVNGNGHGGVKRKAQAAAPGLSSAPTVDQEKAGRRSPLFMAEQNLTATNASAAVVAGKDVQIVNGGGAVLTAGRDLQIQNGGCLVANAGRDVTVERGTVGIVFGRNVTLGPGTRVLIDLSPQKVFGVLEALVMLPVSALLSLMPEGDSKK